MTQDKFDWDVAKLCMLACSAAINLWSAWLVWRADRTIKLLRKLLDDRTGCGEPADSGGGA
jgi:hypothetical protein